MIDALRSTPKQPPQNLRVLQVLAGLFLLLKLTFIFGVGPTSDEAYYWLWAQHPALSYFDHPPLQAWLLGLVRLVLGQDIFALRFLTLVTLAGTLAIFASWAKRYAKENWQLYFWSGTVIYLASGAFGIFFSLAFQDYLFTFLGLVSAHFFFDYLIEVSEKGQGRRRDLYLAAFFLGLCALTKYTALFFGIALIATIVFSRDLRPVLRRIHLYLAALLVIVLQTPTLVWNAQHGFVSLGFQLAGRHGSGGWDWLRHASLDRISEFPLTSLVLVGPFLVPVFVRFFTAQPETPFEWVVKRYAIWIFWTASLTILAASLFDYVNFWWNFPAYIVVMGFAARYMGRFLFYAHAIFGLALWGFLIFNLVVVPIPALSGHYDFRLAQPYGTAELVAPVEAAEAADHPDFVAGGTPEVANQLAFALNDPNVTSLADRLTEFDYWFDRAKHAGQTAIVVLNTADDPAPVAALFGSFTTVAEVPVSRFDHLVRTFRIYLGRGFTPPPRLVP